MRDITAARGKSSSNPPLLNPNNTIKGEGAVWYIESQGSDIVANFGDQFSDLNGGFADRTFKVPHPMYYLP